MARKKDPIRGRADGYVAIIGTRTTQRYTAAEIERGLASLLVCDLELTHQPEITSLPALPPTLRSLGLTRMDKLVDIDSLARCPQLQRISIPHLPSFDLERAFAVLAQLPELADLSLRRVPVPASIERFPSLLKVRLDYVDDLAAGLRHVVRIKHLRLLSINCIEPVPDVFADMPALTELWISSSDPPPSSIALPSLERLRVDCEELTELPETLRRCERLEEVYINAPAIVKLPPWLTKLPHLRTLQLNRVEQLADESRF